MGGENPPFHFGNAPDSPYNIRKIPQEATGYRYLGANASDCIQCGDCEPNCPFGVEIIEKMGQAEEVFQ